MKSILHNGVQIHHIVDVYAYAIWKAYAIHVWPMDSWKFVLAKGLIFLSVSSFSLKPVLKGRYFSILSGIPFYNPVRLVLRAMPPPPCLQSTTMAQAYERSRVGCSILQHSIGYCIVCTAPRSKVSIGRRWSDPPDEFHSTSLCLWTNTTFFGALI